MNPETNTRNKRTFTPLQWAHYNGQKNLAKSIAKKFNNKTKSK